MIETELSREFIELRSTLKCNFTQIDAVFEECIRDAQQRLSEQGVKDYLAGASLVCMIGRGVEPVLQFLYVIPALAERIGEAVISKVSQGVWQASRTPNGEAIKDFMATLGEVSQHLASLELFDDYLKILFDMMERTTTSIHGFHATQPSPGLPPLLRKLWLSLHPVPQEGECSGENISCIRHRLAMLSYAILNPDHGYTNKDTLEFTQRFHDLMLTGTSSTTEVAKIAISYIARTRRQDDQSPSIYFDNTEVDYRDDNRHLWLFIEESDDEEMFEQREIKENEVVNSLPPRLYPEWDYNAASYRPDWVSLYEGLHPAGNPADIDNVLAKHSVLAKRLKKILEVLKPQNYVRVRYQEEGSELDLDVAIRSLINFKSGTVPDPRINMSHKHDSRDISVTLLLDLSASLNDIPVGCTQTILALSQEAVSLLAWAIDKLGDPLSIAGFFSNTRHDVRYLHLKGFSETWNDDVKGRLAKMEAGFSTRMGAAMRHAGHYLSNQTSDKKLLLILTDGEPSDIDVSDDKLLIKDAHQAVIELDQQGIFTQCISLDPKADEYVSDIFGTNYTVIDKVERLPERLPQLFLSLTK